MIRGMRGAITIEKDEPQIIWDETVKLVQAIVAENNVQPDDIASIIISTTPDMLDMFLE